MIRVLQGEKEAEYIKFLCSLMNINEENHNIEFYISSNTRYDFMITKGDVAQIFIDETSNDVKGTIIHMLQKYRFECVCIKDDKNPKILELINIYLAFYYQNTLLEDFMDYIKMDSKKYKEQNIIELNKYIDNIFNNEDFGKHIYDIAKLICYINILDKYGCERSDLFIEEFYKFADVFKELDFMNINEKYYEIEQAWNKYLED